MTNTKPIAEYFDRECCAAVDAGGSPVPGAAGVTAILLDGLEGVGIAGRTVLELGCGDGSLSRALVGRGAAAVAGIDLSPMSVEHARAKATEAGLTDRLSYRIGDGAAAELGEHDALVSDKVFCCYPSPEQLLANSLPAARSIYALVLPESRGLIGVVSRLIVKAENALHRLRRNAFRAYVHDVRRIEERIQGAGFARRLARRHWGWLVLLYERPARR
ncbi:MAG: methyltransferase domain-containing protein [Chloroflexota bacterium]|nr:methyltransferase domain-containing protein [Chloroflexota bacterium]